MPSTNNFFCETCIRKEEDDILIHLTGSFAQADGGLFSFACNLVRDQFSKKCEIFIVQGALAKLEVDI